MDTSRKRQQQCRQQHRLFHDLQQPDGISWARQAAGELYRLECQLCWAHFGIADRIGTVLGRQQRKAVEEKKNQRGAELTVKEPWLSQDLCGLTVDNVSNAPVYLADKQKIPITATTTGQTLHDYHLWRHPSRRESKSLHRHSLRAIEAKWREGWRLRIRKSWSTRYERRAGAGAQRSRSHEA